MTTNVTIEINKDDFAQLLKAADLLNEDKNCPGIFVEQSKHPHTEPDKILVEINFLHNWQLFFNLAKTFGIILQKVNPQPL